MRSKTNFIFWVISFMVLGSIVTTSHAIEIKGLTWKPEDALLYSDLVVEAVIDSYSTERVPIEDFMGWDPRKDMTFPITNLHLRILEVLKGNYEKDILVAVVPGGYPGSVGGLEDRQYNYARGDTTILTLYYSRSMKGGSYVTGTDKGRFILKRGVWENQDVMHRFPSRTLEEIKSIIADESIEEVAKKADVIVLGRILAVQTPEDSLITHVSIIADSTLKGSITPGKQISFRMIRIGLYKPSWRKPVPKVKEGERWLLFLKHGKPGLYPFAGANGMFKVEGDTLIYNNRVYYKYKKPELEKIIIQEVHAR